MEAALDSVEIEHVVVEEDGHKTTDPDVNGLNQDVSSQLDQHDQQLLPQDVLRDLQQNNVERVPYPQKGPQTEPECERHRQPVHCESPTQQGSVLCARHRLYDVCPSLQDVMRVDESGTAEYCVGGELHDGFNGVRYGPYAVVPQQTDAVEPSHQDTEAQQHQPRVQHVVEAERLDAQHEGHERGAEYRVGRGLGNDVRRPQVEPRLKRNEHQGQALAEEHPVDKAPGDGLRGHVQVHAVDGGGLRGGGVRVADEGDGAARESGGFSRQQIPGASDGRAGACGRKKRGRACGDWTGAGLRGR